MKVDRLHVITDDGIALAAEVSGPEGAPALLLSNSLGTTMAMWEPQMAAFAARFRVIRYDGRGQGRSQSPVGATSMDRLGRDALSVLDAVGVSRAHFCGLSMGGMVGQWLTVHAADRLKTLALANTAAFMGPPSAWQTRLEGVLANGMAPLATAALARWFTPAFLVSKPDQAQWVKEILLANDPQGYAACCAAIRDMDLRRIAKLNHVPTLVIAGSADPAASISDAQFIVEAAENATLVTLPAAHLSNVECPAQFTQSVIDYIG